MSQNQNQNQNQEIQAVPFCASVPLRTEAGQDSNIQAIPDILHMSDEQKRRTTICCGEELDIVSIFTEIFGRLPDDYERGIMEEVMNEIELETHQELLLEMKFGTEATTLYGWLEPEDGFTWSYFDDTPQSVLNMDYQNTLLAIKETYQDLCERKTF